MTRGERNNNPGNIEHNPRNKWLGLADPPSDGRFCRFVEMRYGVRALALLLMAYYDRYELRTVRGIIERFAPKGENPTSRYADFVARALGVTVDDKLSLHSADTMFALVKAIIRFENGRDVCSDAQIWEGLQLAGFRPPPPTVIEVARTDTGKGAVAAAGIVAAAASIAEAARPIIEVAAPWGAYGAIVVATIVAVAAVFAWRSRRA